MQPYYVVWATSGRQGVVDAVSTTKEALQVIHNCNEQNFTVSKFSPIFEDGEFAGRTSEKVVLKYSR